MISITDRIASDRAVSVWVIPESSPGVLEYPEAEFLIGAFDITYPTQVPEYTNSKEKAQTRDIINRCQGQLPAGEWAFSTYARPAGAGVTPPEKNLLLALAGQAVVDAGVSVTYSLLTQKPSVSIWFLIDHTMMFCKGATVGDMELNLEDCSLTYQWSGGFMAMGVVGTEILSAEATVAAKIIPIVATDKYSIGGQVVLASAAGAVTDDNGGDGYIIDTIQDGVSLTVLTNLLVGQAAAGFVAPFNPGGSLDGSVLETRHSIVKIATVEKPIVEFTFSVADSPEYLDREKTPVGYPISYAEVQREVTGNVNLAFRRDDADEIKKAYEGVEQAIVLTVGNLAGYIVEIAMPRTKSDVPIPTEAEPIVELDIPYTALGISGEDSYSIVYK